MGFEPTSLLRDYLISSQGRYDRFDTCPYRFAIIPKRAEKIKYKKETAGDARPRGLSSLQISSSVRISPRNSSEMHHRADRPTSV